MIRPPKLTRSVGSTARSRKDVLRSLQIEVAKALAEEPGVDIVGVCCVVLTRQHAGGQLKAREVGIAYGQRAWRGLVEATGTVLKQIGNGLAADGPQG